MYKLVVLRMKCLQEGAVNFVLADHTLGNIVRNILLITATTCRHKATTTQMMKTYLRKSIVICF